MTQPEQEAREMLAACPNPDCGSDKIDVLAAVIEGDDAAAIQGYTECWDCGVRGPKTCGYSGAELSKCRSKAKAKAAEMWNAFARPTAGIDREVTGASLFALWVEAEEARGKEYCSWPDLAGQEMWNFCAETFRRMSLPTAAKTGERGAVIEECARVCDGLFDRATHSDTEAFAYQAAAKAIRALSQPLPDAPIVSGEG